jgi:hypothetical protein
METISVETAARYRNEVENTAIISLAGKAAERRARHGDADGFALWIRSRRHLTALHESAHAAAAIALKRRVYSATVVEDSGVKVGNGHMGGIVWTGSAPKAPPLPEQKPERLESDEKKAARLSMLLSNDMRWRGALRTMRELREKSRIIVDHNWVSIVAFAEVLMKSETIGQEEAEHFLRHCA